MNTVVDENLVIDANNAAVASRYQNENRPATKATATGRRVTTEQQSRRREEEDSFKS